MNKYKVCSFSADVETMRLLKQEAEIQGVSMSALIREGIWRILEDHGHVRPIEPVDPELLKGLRVMKSVKVLARDVDDFNERFKTLLNSC